MKYSLKSSLIAVFVIGMIVLAFLHFFGTSDAEGFVDASGNVISAEKKTCLEKCVSEAESSKRLACFLKCGLK